MFHYELERIHHFADGNGRVARLWNTMLLSKWNSVFAWIPVESIIHNRQQEYYVAINASNAVGESTVFVEFMLSSIKRDLIEAISRRDRDPNKLVLRWAKVKDYLQTHNYIWAPMSWSCVVSRQQWQTGF